MLSDWGVFSMQAIWIIAFGSWLYIVEASLDFCILWKVMEMFSK